MITSEELQLSKMSYTDKDFASLYPDLLDLARQLTNKWDPSLSNESDPGVVLLKEGAFIADHNNYNTDKNVLENFLPSATQDRSVRNIVEMNGYTPGYYVSATGLVSFTFNNNSKESHYEDGSEINTFTIPAYTIVLTNEDETVAYTQVSNLVIGGKGIKSSCTFMEGTLNTLTVNNSETILLENIDENNRLYLPDPYIAQNGVFVKNINADDSDLWTRNNYLLTQPIGSKVYKVDFDSNLNLPFIEFPQDIANIIDRGLSVKFISTSGLAGNVKAGTLTKIKSPTSYDGKQYTMSFHIDMSDFSVSNSSSFLNGKDPETINEMYQSFKKIVGTFDTLVTCRDYSNAVYELKDDYDNPIVSNAVVTDRRNDYNGALNIVTYDEYGKYFENVSLNQGITTYRFVDTAASDYTPQVGDIKYELDSSASPFKVCTSISDDSEGAIWEPITELSYNSFVTASEAMSPYDLSIYALRAFSMADYTREVPEQALNNSFLPATGDTYGLIKNGLHDLRCINHTFRDPKDGDVLCFKNYVPLNITIIPYHKVTKNEKDEIISNIYIALTENFNARMIDFGEELNYDEVVDVILNCDNRIKNIRLEDFEYIPVAVKYDSSNVNGTLSKEVSVYSYVDIMVDLIAKNVLAGRLCLFNFDDTFTHSYGQVNAAVYSGITEVGTEVDIPVEVPDSGEIIETPDDEQQPTTYTFSEDYTITLGINYAITGEPYNPDNSEEGCIITINQNQSLNLNPGCTLTVYTSSDDDDYYYGPTVDNSLLISIENNTDGQISFYTDGSSAWRGDGELSSESSGFIPLIGSDIKVNITNVGGDNGTEDFDYDLKDNEYIQIAYPSYYSSIIYPTYCNYRFASSDDTESIVPANTDYVLKAGENLFIVYTSDNKTQSVTYQQGTVINSTFELSSKTNYLIKKQFGTGSNQKQMTFNTISAGDQIAIREKMETVLDNINTPCYWIRNNSGNILFYSDNDPKITEPGGEGNGWIILNSGEYFIYSNSNFDTMNILGAGTKITRSEKHLSEQWATSDATTTNIETINKNGFNSNIAWVTKDFSGENNLTLTEMVIITLGPDDNVKVFDWGSEKPDVLSNDWTKCSGAILYKVNSEPAGKLEKLNTSDGYVLRSRLDLSVGNDKSQKLLENQTVTLKYLDSSTAEYKQITIHGKTPDESDTDTNVIQSSTDLDIIGDDNVDLGIITSNYNLNILTYNENKPSIVYGELVPVDDYIPSEFDTTIPYYNSRGVRLAEPPKPFETSDESWYLYNWYSLISNPFYYSTGDYDYQELDSNNGSYSIDITNGVGFADFPFSYTDNITADSDVSKEYILPIFLNCNHDDNVAIKASIINDTEETSESEYSFNVKIKQYNGVEIPSDYVYLDNKEMYLLVPVVDWSSNYESSESELNKIDINLNLRLRLEWTGIPNSTESITLYPFKISLGMNTKLTDGANTYSLGNIISRIDELIANSDKPDVKPYYINEPDLSMAIQDEDIINPDIFWDKNNVANAITIAQVDIQNSNIDVIKSMRAYSAKEDK